MRNQLLKSVIILGMGLFLFSRILNSSVLFYINERFVWLTFAASIGFALVSISYIIRLRKSSDFQGSETHDHHHHDKHSHHDHGQDHTHSHGLSAFGISLLLIPILLGLLIPPQPLGSAAMANRELNTGTLSLAAPASGNVLSISTGSQQKNIIDWLIAFQQSLEKSEFGGQDATVTGFVYQNKSLPSDEAFMLSRFAVSCCAADATPVGLVVRWNEASNLEPDQWVEVSGKFEIGEFRGEPAPILIADSIIEIEPPAQPYLYY